MSLPLNEHCAPDRTVDNCHALAFTFTDDSRVIQWRDRPRAIVPEEKGKRLSELEAGDVVVYRKERRVVAYVEIYR
ncbi:MAG: hypothetical protein AAGJ46_21180 [Planctomycetota bacterium]